MSRTPLRPWACVLVTLGFAGTLPGQAPDPAGMLLAGARRAYNEKNYPFAAARFREFLARFGGHKDSPSARYGLALCLLEGPTRDYPGAAEQLAPLAGNKDFPDRPFALYYLGLARRGQGLKALEQAAAKPAESAHHRNVARGHFEEAAKQFASAASAFGEKVRDVKPGAKLPADAEWSARARCDQAEMLLRLRKPREARAAVAGFLDDKKLRASRYRRLGLYYHGFACFLLEDHFAAGKSLSLLAPFSDPVFGTHARYLLARVHHLNTRQDERAEAREHYEGVLADHEQRKKEAADLLRQPEHFRNDPEEKSRLEGLVRGPAPDHVARAAFFLGVMQYEEGQFAPALERLRGFVTQFPSSPLAPEARLRQGFCEVQLKQFDPALKTLQPLADKDPALADQALLWIAKAQLGKADPKNPGSYKVPIDTLKKAAEKAAGRATATPPDPNARARRGEVLIELGEAQQLARQFKDATATYEQVRKDKLLPRREDEVLHYLATAWQLAGDYNESDKVCAAFTKSHPKSPLLPAVLFRHAENAYFLARLARKLPNPADRAREEAKYNDLAVERYREVVEKYPEFKHVQLARHGLAMALYRKGDLEKARTALEAIPAGERTGELAVVSYQLADVLIRLAPAKAEDAVAAGKLEEMLRSASEQLDAFLAAQPEGPHAPDALLKLGYCQQRMAKLLAQPEERDKLLTAARATYDRLLAKYTTHPAYPQAVIERAKVMALAKQVDAAANELRRFTREDPLKKSPVAPMALLHLATLLRGQNKSAEAADVLALCRKEYEPGLLKAGDRAGWVPLLRYHQAVSLREAGKLSEARALFEQLAREHAGRPEGWESALRAGQCRKEEGEKKIAEAQKQFQTPGLRPEQAAAAQKRVEAGANDVREAVKYFAAQAEVLKKRKPGSEEQGRALEQARARMGYESAWAFRALAALEVESARKKIREERWQKLRDEAVRRAPPGSAPAVAMPEVADDEVPLQPAERQARERYEALVKEFPELPLGVDARFELAELLGRRGEHARAVQLLQEALEKEPPPELTDKIKLRLGAALLDSGVRKLLAGKKKAGEEDLKSALEQLQPITENPKSPVLAQALYREGECYLHLGKPEEAVKRLVKFRDQDPFRSMAGLADRALLRLGNALGEAKQWDASRQAYEGVLARFPKSPWAHEARYGIGWAYQNTGQYDQAVNEYNQVTAAVVTRLGARAQLNVGLCRLAQKRYAEAGTALLVVPFTYDYPDLSALALVEAARAFAENKQPRQARDLLRRVLRDHAGTPQAEVARKRLKELSGG